jgi:hypothetical protein
VHRNTNRKEIISKMRPCSRLYYFNVSFSFVFSDRTVFLCIHVDLTAALEMLDNHVFSKFGVLEFEVMKVLIELSALKLSH